MQPFVSFFVFFNDQSANLQAKYITLALQQTNKDSKYLRKTRQSWIITANSFDAISVIL